MKRALLIITCFGIILFIGGCGQQQEKVTKDTVATHVSAETVQFENEYVKVTEFMLKPGDNLPLHKGGPRVVYAFSDYKIKWTEEGQVIEKEWKKGDVHWHEALDHAVENIGYTDASYMVITRKEISLPDAGDYTIEQDATQLDSENANCSFENEFMRIIEVKLAVGESQPTHHGVNRLIYSLTSYQIEYLSDQMDIKNTKADSGDIHWHTADKHAVKNNGETIAHYLIFEFKQ